MNYSHAGGNVVHLQEIDRNIPINSILVSSALNQEDIQFNQEIESNYSKIIDETDTEELYDLDPEEELNF